jgi:hypothetical protein
MKYALIKNNKVELISYEPIDGFVEVNDNVFADMIKKPDGSFNYSDELLIEQEQFRIAEQNKKEQEKQNKQSALNKLSALGLTADEIKAIIG